MKYPSFLRSTTLSLFKYSALALFLFQGTALFAQATGDAMYINASGNIGIGTDAPGEKLEVKGNIFINDPVGHIRFTHKYGDGNDGKIGNSMFAPGLNIVGINNDNTHRKILLWGSITQFENNLSNTWIGNNIFNGQTSVNSTFSVTGTSNLTGAVNISGNTAIGTSAANAMITLAGTMHITGDYLYVKSEGKGRLRVGAVFGMPGLYSGDDGANNLSLGAPRGQKIYFGWEDKDAYVESGSGNAYFKGKVGIGTTDARAPIHVASVKGTGGDIGGNSAELGYGRGGAHNLYPGRAWGACSIFAEGHIVTRNAMISTEAQIPSDIRLKKDIRRSSSSKDLSKLMEIEITDYKMIDTIANNNRYKKVIAQQVAEVYPLATRQMTYTIPDVYQPAEVESIGINEYQLSVAKAHKLQSGDKVELKCNDETVNVTIDKITSLTSFTVKTMRDLNNDKAVFVYGKEVDDLLVIDYDALSMLNISATQELAKRIADQQKRIEQLEAELKLQKTENEQLKNTQARLTQLEEKMKNILVPRPEASVSLH